MPFKKALNTSEVPVGNMKHVNVEGTEILVANVGETYYAINNTCPHMGGSLGEGKLEGNIIHCPKHGAMFDVISGKNVGPAKIAFTKLKVKDVQSYPIKVAGNDIFVEV
ncbi:MAG: Rieske 2Fe-2S domain-containing protein [Patescibacteria group bacterium]